MKLILPLVLGLTGVAQAQYFPTFNTNPPSHVEPEKNDAASILKRVEATYKAMESYRANGTIISEKEMGGTTVRTTTTYSILLKKPNLYLITWNQTAVPAALPQGGAVWNDGTQPYLYLLMNKSYAKVGDDVSALGAANAISDGATNTIPSLFLPSLTSKGFALARLRDPVIEKSEYMGGNDCFVLSGSSAISKKETFWISKSSNLILKYEKSLETPDGGAAGPEVSEEVIEKAIRAMGQPVTEENKKQVREMVVAAKGSIKNSENNGISTETQMEITNPKLTEKDFTFTPPAGTAQTDSMMGSQTEPSPLSPPPADAKEGK